MSDPEYAVSITTDKPLAVYERGEPATFVATVSRNGHMVAKGEVKYAVKEDGLEPMATGIAPLSDGRAEVRGQLDKPGFIQCQVEYEPRDGERVSAAVGAGVAPLAIQPSLPAPDDFRTFWEEQKNRLAAIPLEADLQPAVSVVEDVDCFDVKVACVDETPVSGYLAQPKGASSGSLPAILLVHGAGVGPGDPNVALHAQRGLLALDINAHGLPNDRAPEYYQKLAEGALQDYRVRGREDRGTLYFLGMFLRVKRALDFLTSRPEWDGSILVTRGSSQGGAQAIAGAALDERVTGLVAGVPAMCGHTGCVVGRASGWPKLVSPDDAEELRNRVVEAARYFDMVNFVTLSRAEAIFSVGFLDAACNPTTVYAAYNNFPGPKQIINRPAMGHEAPEDINAEFTKWVLAHVGRRRSEP